MSESARNDKSFDIVLLDKIIQFAFSIFALKGLHIQKMYFDAVIVVHTCMLKCFDDAHIAIGEMSIFSRQCNMDRLWRIHNLVDENFPLLHIRLSLFSEKSFLDQEMNVLLLESEWYFINRFLIECFYDMIRIDISKHRKLIFDFLLYRFTASAYENTWVDTQLSEFNHRMLDRFGFHFSRSRDRDHRHDMDDHTVFSPELIAELSDRFDKVESLDISDSTSYFYDSDISICSEYFDFFFDFICDMGNDLYGLTQIISSSFFFYDRQIYLT